MSNYALLGSSIKRFEDSKVAHNYWLTALNILGETLGFEHVPSPFKDSKGDKFLRLEGTTEFIDISKHTQSDGTCVVVINRRTF